MVDQASVYHWIAIAKSNTKAYNIFTKLRAPSFSPIWLKEITMTPRTSGTTTRFVHSILSQLTCFEVFPVCYTRPLLLVGDEAIEIRFLLLTCTTCFTLFLFTGEELRTRQRLPRLLLRQPRNEMPKWTPSAACLRDTLPALFRIDAVEPRSVYFHE